MRRYPCWDIVRKYNSTGHVKNGKSRGRPENWDSKEEKTINLSQNDPKKIQLNFYGILIQKKRCSTSLIRRILISCQLHARIAIKNPILRREIDLPEMFGQMNMLYFPKIFSKVSCFWTKQLWNFTLTNEY